MPQRALHYARRAAESTEELKRAIAIDGNSRTTDALIRKKLGLRLGDLVTQTALDQAQHRLERTHRFKSVTVSLEPGPDPAAPSRVTLVWQVNERG